jgi:PEP-CTERM motif
VFAAGLTVTVSVAHAAPIVYTGSQGSLAASVSFEVSGTDLIVVLTSTSSADVLVPTDVLTGVGFTLSGNPTLSRTSAVLNTGSTVFYDPDGQPAGGVVGGEWAYKSGISYQGALQGISSSGLGIFGPGDRFPGANLAGPLDPDGLQYGLLSAGDNTATGNGGVLGSDGLIKNSVIFTLGSLPVTFDPFTSISNVVFQYGAALDEPHFSGTCTSNCSPPSAPVPEPGGIALLGGALAGFGLLRYRRKT